MFEVGFWMDGILRPLKMDMSMTGAIDVRPDHPGRSYVGFFSHQFASVVFALPYAAWLATTLPGGGWVRGFRYGVIFLIVMSVARMILKGLGGKVLAQAVPAGPMIGTSLIIHVIWGAVLGAMYVPPHG